MKPITVQRIYDEVSESAALLEQRRVLAEKIAAALVKKSPR